MGLTKQAKVLTTSQIKAVLKYIETTRYPNRNRLLFLLSIKAGLRAKEMAEIRWRMICDAEFNIIDQIALDNASSKGKHGGRVIPLNKDLRDALVVHFNDVKPTNPQSKLFQSERAASMSAKVIANWFKRLYSDMGYEGCSSHSGRRTFITNAAKNITRVGGSLRDVQLLAGHSNLATTQLYIQSDTHAIRKIVDLI